ncbi:MAG: hypothetical protein MJE77_44235 [Proteobacteria bacterium]|nr:hypothetical protein [Pseudomonadota bacterium]
MIQPHSRMAGSSIRLGAVVSSLCAAGLFFTAACDKPKEDDCKLALNNIRKLYGTETDDVGADMSAMIRTCRGSASPESVRCFIDAKKKEDLQKCEGDTFAKLFAGDEGGGDEKVKKEEPEKKDP